MRKLRLRDLFTPLAGLVSMAPVYGAVSISSPAVPNPFDTLPPASDWSTVSVGTATDATITTVAQFDAKIIAAANAANVTGILLESGTFDATTGPSANAVARRNTGTASPGGVKFLQTRPTGVDYLLMKATLSNDTGANLNAVKIAYDFSKFAVPTAGGETLKGAHVYWSLDGTPGSWQNLPSVSIDTNATVQAPQAVSANIALPTPLPPGGTMYILWADPNSSGDDSSYLIRNFAASPGVNCSISGTAVTPVRNPGVDPASPADDTVTFSTIVTGTGDVGPGWTVVSGPGTGTNGSYGETLSYDLPITAFSAGPVTIRVQDQATAECFFEKTVAAPPFIYSVTPTSGQTITFTPSAVGDGSYTPPSTGLTEPGWSGGTTSTLTTVSNVQTQPAPSTSLNKYFHITTNGLSLATDPVSVDAIKGTLLKNEIDLAFYSTSTTSLDAADVLNIRLEIAQDGNFANTAVGNIITTNIKDVLAGEGPAFAASIAVGPDYINLGAGPAFPSTDFTFHKFVTNVLVPATAPKPYARVVVQTITDFGNSEHLLVDNISFAANTEPSLQASTAGAATFNNQGTVTPTDDRFTVPVNITSFNLGVSPGWTSDETPARSGLYTDPNPVTFGPYPGRTPVNVTLHDQTNPAVTSGILTLAPPAGTLTATLVAGSVIRNANGPGDADDTISFQATVSGTNGGPQFTMAAYPATATTTTPALSATPTTVDVTLSPAPEHGSVIVAFSDASYPNLTANVTVAVPSTNATQYIIGQKNFGAGLSDVVTDPLNPLPAEWINFPGIRALEMTNGGGGATKVIVSERIDLTGVSGNVNFSARLRAIDRTTGFELADTFLAELIIDDDVAVPVNLITPYDDVTPNGVMNGADTTVPADDEFNAAAVTDGSYTSDFNLSHVIPDAATSVQLRLTAVNDSVNETFIVENVLFTNSGTPPNADTDGDGATDAAEAVAGTDPNNPNDVLRLAQNAANRNQIDFPTKAGRFYRVYVSDDNAENTHLMKWNDAGQGTISGDGTTKNFNVTVQAGENRRFYRIMVMTTDGATGTGDWPATIP